MNDVEKYNSVKTKDGSIIVEQTSKGVTLHVDDNCHLSFVSLTVDECKELVKALQHNIDLYEKRWNK